MATATYTALTDFFNPVALIPLYKPSSIDESHSCCLQSWRQAGQCQGFDFHAGFKNALKMIKDCSSKIKINMIHPIPHHHLENIWDTGLMQSLSVHRPTAAHLD